MYPCRGHLLLLRSLFKGFMQMVALIFSWQTEIREESTLDRDLPLCRDKHDIWGRLKNERRQNSMNLWWRIVVIMLAWLLCKSFIPQCHLQVIVYADGSSHFCSWLCGSSSLAEEEKRVMGVGGAKACLERNCSWASGSNLIGDSVKDAKRNNREEESAWFPKAKAWIIQKKLSDTVPYPENANILISLFLCS